MNKYLYVVEGNMDLAKLKSLGCQYVYKTNGYGIKRETYRFLEEAEKVRPLVLLLDPDMNGRTIREMLKLHLSNYISLDIPYAKAKGKRKLGVAETKNKDLFDIMKKYIEQDKQNDECDTLSLDEFIDLKLAGDDSHKNKEILFDKYSLRIGTNKALLTDINILRLTKEQLQKDLDNGKNNQ